MPRLLPRLRALHPDLSPVQKRVAGYVLEHPDATIYHSVTELAEATRSSEGSIIRFCQELGFSGFQEFKLKLAVELSPAGRAGAPGEADGGRAAAEQNLLAEITSGAAAAMADTASLFDAAAFDSCVRALTDSRHIDIYGVGASGIIADYWAYKFLRLGLPAQAFTDPHLAAMSASGLPENSLAIGISSSGSTKDTMRALEAAREGGALTVSVTNRLKSPLTRVADLNLFASPPESPLTGGDVFAKIGQLLILEGLTRQLLALNGDRLEAVQRTAQAVSDRSL